MQMHATKCVQGAPDVAKVFQTLDGVCVSTSVTKSFECRGVQHLWSTARNEATTTDGKGSRTLDPIPADQHTDSNGPPCRCLFVSMVLA